MSVYVYVIGTRDSSFRPPDDSNIEVNNALKTLQDKNARIVDVKLSTCSEGENVVTRTYVIIYEADKKFL